MRAYSAIIAKVVVAIVATIAQAAPTTQASQPSALAADLPRGLECRLQGMNYIYPLANTKVKLDVGKKVQTVELSNVKE